MPDTESKVLDSEELGETMKEILKEIVKTLELQAIATGALEKTLLAGKGDQLVLARAQAMEDVGKTFAALQAKIDALP
jgi:hypothetical protein